MIDKVNEPASLMAHADSARRHANGALDDTRRAALGQFMTPAPIAGLMAEMFELGAENIRLLDAGAGVGSLTAAVVAELCSRKRPPSSIDATAFEIEPLMLEQLRVVLRTCEHEARRAGVRFHGRRCENDFISSAVALLDPGLFRNETLPRFNAAILNPPYRKIHSDSIERSALRAAGIEASNLYAAFVALAIKLLEPGGEIVAITPRSFCNGPYFRPFRRLLLGETALLRVHVFETRDTAFKDDAVLQENVIFHAKKGATQGRIELSVSSGPSAQVRSRTVPSHAVVAPEDPNAFIHLAVCEEDDVAAARIAALPCSLGDLGLNVSTGRVVDFRAREFLRRDPEPRSVPLIYPAHFQDGYVAWPRNGGRKPNALADRGDTRALMVPNATYVLTKRFTSKEERRRVVAVVFDPTRLPPQIENVGFENHVNYFHAAGAGLSKALAKGLAVFLNTSLADRYFRRFNGHTQVNASDLRSFRYPSATQLRAIGQQVGASFPDQERIDRIVEGVLSSPKD